MKIYNDQTGCYKIDIFVNNEYFCSTDKSKTCKEAKKRFLDIYPKFKDSNIKCFFDKM